METLHWGLKKKVKAARRAGWVWWKGRRKRLPKSLFSASLSQMHRYMWLRLSPGRGGVTPSETGSSS
jgi:hypothetical protein